MDVFFNGFFFLVFLVRGVRKINNSENKEKKRKKSKCCMENSEIYVCGKQPQKKKPLLIFCAMVFRARVFSSHLQTRKIFPLFSGSQRVHTEAGERDDEVVKKEIFCSCVHYKANTSIHICSHLWGVFWWGKRSDGGGRGRWRKIRGSGKISAPTLLLFILFLSSVSLSKKLY